MLQKNYEKAMKSVALLSKNNKAAHFIDGENRACYSETVIQQGEVFL